MRRLQWIAGGLSTVVLASLVDAQRVEGQRAEEVRQRATAVVARSLSQVAGNPSDAVLGINTSSTGERDTLGLLVTSVTPGGPAEKAGVEEGNRISSVNGVNLKLAKEDAGHGDMHGMTTRRLVREMQKVDAGQSVELSIWKSGRYQPVTVQTVAREDLPGQEPLTREDARERAVVGLTLQTTGSIRDTLGPMVVRVAAEGPAERAGIVEGDRIQSVNGTSLRVAREDAEEPAVGTAKVNRFSRELRDLDVGASVEVQVYSGGQTRTVRITTAKADDVYGEESGGMFFYRSGDGGWGVPAMAPLPPTPPTPMSGRLEFRGYAPAMTVPRVQVRPMSVPVRRSGGVI